MESQFTTLACALHFIVCFMEGDAYLFRGNGLLRCLVQLLNGLLVVSQILLASDENNRKSLAEVKHFGNPLKSILVMLTTLFAVGAPFSGISPLRKMQNQEQLTFS